MQRRLTRRRLEGPGIVLHILGWPHVQAAIHLADEGGAGPHMGEALAEARSPQGPIGPLSPWLRLGARPVA